MEEQMKEKDDLEVLSEASAILEAGGDQIELKIAAIEEDGPPKDIYNVGDLRLKVRSMVKQMVEEEFQRVIDKLGLRDK